MPHPRSGWGACDWSAFYPFLGAVWPAERAAMFDACSRDVLTLAIITNAAALVCLLVGAVAPVIGKQSGPARRTWAAGLAIACVLVQLLARVSSSPDEAHINWFPTMGVGVSLIAGGAVLGYIGAAAAAAVRSRRKSSPSTQDEGFLSR